MTEDPVFVRAGGRAIDGVHDLSSRRVDACDPDPPPPRVCGDTYCGPGGSCGDVDGAPGCLCADGFVARRITVAGQESVACQDEDADFLASVLDGDADPCAGFSCGDDGRCEAVNGAPTCACAPGFAAVVDGDAPGLVCREPSARFSSDELLWPPVDDARGDTRFDDEGCAAAEARDPLRGLFGLASLFLIVSSFARVLRGSRR
jgi:hypothetical protein